MSFWARCSAVLDGEIVAFNEAGRPDFGRLQQRLHLGSRGEVARRAHEVAASFLAFDLLYLDGNLSLLTFSPTTSVARCSSHSPSAVRQLR